ETVERPEGERAADADEINRSDGGGYDQPDHDAGEAKDEVIHPTRALNFHDQPAADFSRQDVFRGLSNARKRDGMRHGREFGEVEVPGEPVPGPDAARLGHLHRIDAE